MGLPSKPSADSSGNGLGIGLLISVLFWIVLFFVWMELGFQGWRLVLLLVLSALAIAVVLGVIHDVRSKNRPPLITWRWR